MGFITGLGLLCAAQFVLQLDLSIVNVALPTIQRELGFAAANLQWVVTGYALTFGSLLLLGGRAGDSLGRRRFLQVGLTFFALASLTCGLALSPLMLIISRMVQGAGAAFVSPSALALLTTTNAEGPARNQALSLWQASTAAGASAGVIAGGVLTQYLGWRAIFLVNLPIIGILLLLIPRVLPDDTRRGGGQRLDVFGAALATASAAALIYGLSSGQQQGFGSRGALVALLGAAALALAFVLFERRDRVPLVPFSYFASATHRAAVGGTLLVGAVLAAYVYFISLYLQRVLGTSPLVTGLALIPATATIVLITTIETRLLDRLGVKRMFLIGLALMALGQVALSFVSGGGSYVVNVLPGQLLTSLGIAFALPTASIGATAGLGRGEQGLAGGLLTTSLQIGAAIGLALLATLAAARTARAGSLATGYGFSYRVAAGILLLAILLVATQLNRRACQSEVARQRRAAAQARAGLSPQGSTAE
jgi:EmrB/QacA subfamily drug resistance transporter